MDANSQRENRVRRQNHTRFVERTVRTDDVRAQFNVPVGMRDNIQGSDADVLGSIVDAGAGERVAGIRYQVSVPGIVERPVCG